VLDKCMQKSLISLVIPVGRVTSDSVSLYFQKREENGELNGLWEFPGGKIEANEIPLEAAKREYLEECGVEVGALVLFKTFSFNYSEKSLCFYCYLTKCDGPVEQFKEMSFDLDTRSQKYENTFPAADLKLIDEAVGYLAKQEECGEFEKIWK